jgi:RNA polymerase primary sigma factor
MRAPTTKELSDEIGVPLTDLEFIMQIDSGMLSLDMEGEEDSASIGDFQEDYTFSPERDFMKKTTRADTLRFLDRLKDREKRILVYRFQLDGEARYSLKKISDKMGISPETVRQIEQRALRKIRPHAEELRKCVCT